jgi:PhnB protein
MHAMLETEDGFTLMASDTPSGMQHIPGNSMSVSLSGDDSERLHRYWDKLCEGADVTMAMDKQPWGDEFGMCVDRYGIRWMVDIAPGR